MTFDYISHPLYPPIFTTIPYPASPYPSLNFYNVSNPSNSQTSGDGHGAHILEV